MQDVPTTTLEPLPVREDREGELTSPVRLREATLHRYMTVAENRQDPSKGWTLDLPPNEDLHPVDPRNVKVLYEGVISKMVSPPSAG